jgi:hypothetical protein
MSSRYLAASFLVGVAVGVLIGTFRAVRYIRKHLVNHEGGDA